MNWEGILDNIITLAGYKLNDWEHGFIEDIMSKYQGRYDKLTEKQQNTILKIQTKYLKS